MYLQKQVVQQPRTLYIHQTIIWVLYPFLETEDENLQYYYDFSQSLEEYTKIFNEIGAEWKWQPVSTQNYKQIIAAIPSLSGDKIPLVLNLCDGDETNDVPGVSVVKELVKQGLIFTGADEHFYKITTSKIPMKYAFDAAGIPTPAWAYVRSKKETTMHILKATGVPAIIKPAVSGGSMGVGVKNVVHNQQALDELIESMFNGYRGWNLTADGIIAESFINGPEYTVLISGSAQNLKQCKVYPAIERVFHHSLPPEEKFLSFDRLWETYDTETAMPGQDNFYEYQPAPSSLQNAIRQISLQAYKALGGTGYTRLDIRMDSTTGILYVLEANAQCGLSDDENYTSIGAILRFANTSFTKLITEILEDAARRKGLELVMTAP